MADIFEHGILTPRLQAVRHHTDTAEPRDECAALPGLCVLVHEGRKVST